MRGVLVFDFDGVIADSEVIANQVLAEFVTEMGVPTSVEDSYRKFMGKRFVDVIASIEAAIGYRVAPGFPEIFQQRTYDRFRAELKPVQGATDYLDAFRHVPRCIASSSSPDRLALCLDILGLESEFEQYVYSASMVNRGKPHPDIFLHAAKQMGAEPGECLVLEDSVSGVQAGRAAGMTVIGLTAASHVQEGHDARLRSAGAHHVAASFTQAASITEREFARLADRSD